MDTLIKESCVKIYYFLRNNFDPYKFKYTYEISKTVVSLQKEKVEESDFSNYETPQMFESERFQQCFEFYFDKTPFTFISINEGNEPSDTGNNHNNKTCAVNDFTIDEFGDYIFYNNEIIKYNSNLSLNEPFALITDLDGTLLGDHKALLNFNKFWLSNFKLNSNAKLIYNSGRNIREVLRFNQEINLLLPDVSINNVGSAIFMNDRFTNSMKMDEVWSNILDKNWDNSRIMNYLSNFKDITFNVEENNKFLIYSITTPKVLENFVNEHLDKMIKDFKTENIEFKFIIGRDQHNFFPTFCPLKGGKNNANQYILQELNFNIDNMLCCGDSANDIDMLEGCRWGIIVSNSFPELLTWFNENNHNNQHIKISKYNNANAIIEEIKEKFKL